MEVRSINFTKFSMANFNSVFKEEIGRLSRKEVRAETDQLKKSSARYRAEIAELKRRIASLETMLRKVAKGGTAKEAATAVEEGDDESLRFRASGLASHRKRLGVSADGFAKLIGVSAQTVYNWEAGQTKPRASQMKAIAVVRNMGKKEAAQALEVLKVAEPQ